MDPHAAWKQLLEARHDQDWDRVEELAEGLLEWIRKSGFPPETVGNPEIGDAWHRAITRFVCRTALNDVKAARKRSSRK